MEKAMNPHGELGTIMSGFLTNKLLNDDELIRGYDSYNYLHDLLDDAEEVSDIMAEMGAKFVVKVETREEKLARVVKFRRDFFTKGK
jgi:hypothetical protein